MLPIGEPAGGWHVGIHTDAPVSCSVDHAVERIGHDDVGVDVDDGLRLAQHARLRLQQPRRSWCKRGRDDEVALHPECLALYVVQPQIEHRDRIPVPEEW